MKYKIQWEVNDGYCGGARPQYTNFDSNDYVDDVEWIEMAEEERQDYLDEAVQTDFEQLGFTIMKKNKLNETKEN